MGERFEVLFVEVMNDMMLRFVKGVYVGVWVVSDLEEGNVVGGVGMVVVSSVFMILRGFGGDMIVLVVIFVCIKLFKDWVEKWYV